MGSFRDAAWDKLLFQEDNAGVLDEAVEAERNADLGLLACCHYRYGFLTIDDLRHWLDYGDEAHGEALQHCRKALVAVPHRR